MTHYERHQRALEISERVYKALLKAHPEEFRNEYGLQMSQAFQDSCGEELECSGMVGLVKLWLRTILDLVMTALVERSSGRANDQEAVMKDYKLAGIGFVLLLAPLFFASASLLKHGLGMGLLFDPLKAFLAVAQRRDVFNLVSPSVLVGGLGLALNAYAVLRLSVSKEDSTIVNTVRLSIKFLNSR